MKLLGTRSNHQRGASLQISITSPPDLKSAQKEICNNPSNSEKLHLPEIKDATTCVVSQLHALYGITELFSCTYENFDGLKKLCEYYLMLI